jgi:hypothetical protein
MSSIVREEVCVVGMVLHPNWKGEAGGERSWRSVCMCGWKLRRELVQLMLLARMWSAKWSCCGVQWSWWSGRGRRGHDGAYLQ